MWPPWWPRIQTKAARASGSSTSAGDIAATAASAASATSGYRRSRSFTCGSVAQDEARNALPAFDDCAVPTGVGRARGPKVALQLA